ITTPAPPLNQARSRGTSLMPATGFGHHPSRQWVVARRGAVRGRDLAPPGDAEPLTDLLVGAACRNQLDDLPLALRDRRDRVLEGFVHDSRDAISTTIRR